MSGTTIITERGNSKSAHPWISIIFCMLNTYVITTTKMKLFYSSKAVRPQGGTFMYTPCTNILPIKYQSQIINIIDCSIL